MSGMASAITATAEVLARYDQPGPRYTSYPTAVEFCEEVGEADYRGALRVANRRASAPLSVYMHLPFCEQRCRYCGCHVIISPDKQRAQPYLDRLAREIELVAAELSDRRGVAQLHLGGGTPTYFAPERLGALIDSFKRYFTVLPGAELALEVDPRVTTREHIDRLVDHGFNRVSMGVQDFTPKVQEAVDRIQTPEETERLAAHMRERGIGSLNVDLIYGLPHQRLEDFAATLDRVISMRPDRVAVYSFAYVPWRQGTQKQIDEAALPRRDEKFALYALARTKFLAAGYQAIGMDHFALPEDELSIARREGRLHRNFMGYTVMPGEDAIGFGVSAIGDVGGYFVQNERKLSTYHAALDAGRLPTRKGLRRSGDDEIRRDVIQSLMCNFRVEHRPLERRHGIVFEDYFAEELLRLAPHVEQGLAIVDEEGVRATPTGELFVRNLAMCFDAYLAKHQEAAQPVFSRTV